MEHHPVLARRVVEIFAPALDPGGVFVDATLGRGGHAAEILRSAPGAKLIGIDRDAGALEASRAFLRPFEDRIRLVRGNFQDLASVLERLGVPSVRGVLLDLGVSSPQLDEAHRGFSFRSDGPLDMRMDVSQSLTADDVVNRYDEKELARTIRSYGEERFARRIAAAIVKARPVEGTARLAEIVTSAIPAATRRAGGHPARRTFQAIRIEVNRELDALRKGLPAAIDALEPGGRIAVLSYHSLEDRVVKRTFQEESRGCVCPPGFPVCTCSARARLRILTRRPWRPDASEVQSNPRAGAAKLRAAERITPAETAPPSGPAALQAERKPA
ncbi:MAG TPA: 16S rRNA (cytosine(1402)-N(4))-methyltransferase RsmH [Actinomycetota bacterium]|nr:16S rRNA (cytosine(1402)-N(4))-methyltransferase RsmH [Actinomycetota bacterium]